MRVLPLMVMALLLLAADTWGAEGKRCGDQMCCTNAACCKHDAGDAALGPMEQMGVIPPGSEWPAGTTDRPVREYAKVMFYNPVRVVDTILIGPYIIEHDEERMARGEPCTHIYALHDRQVPVIAFQCQHLDRKATERATVTLRRTPDPYTRIFELVEFQFEGSADGHGVPDQRR